MGGVSREMVHRRIRAMRLLSSMLYLGVSTPHDTPTTTTTPHLPYDHSRHFSSATGLTFPSQHLTQSIELGTLVGENHFVTFGFLILHVTAGIARRKFPPVDDVLIQR